MPNVAFWNQENISRKAPGRWRKDILLGRQGRREGFKGSLGRREGFKGSLVPNVAFWNQKKISKKAPGRWPQDMAGGHRTCCWAAKGAGKGLRARAPGESARQVATGHGRWPQDILLGRQGRREGFKGSLGRREGFKGSLVPNVAFWNQKKISKKAPGRWPQDTAGGHRTCCWAAKGAGKGLRAGQPRRRESFKGSLVPNVAFWNQKKISLGKRPAGGERTCCWAAKGAGRVLKAASCLTSLSETRRKSPRKRPAGGHRTCCWAAKGAGKG